MAEKASIYKVTAIVSVYKAERFLRQCLEDIARQTIFAQTEVIIVDACSPENEGAIAHEFMERYPNIVYVRTPVRETLYASWNRAIGMARGQYLTNANADDRHAPHCFERLAAELDAHPDVGMVYAQCRVTGQINALFESAPVKRLLQWLPYDHLNLMRRCEVGPQPMWRASVHEKAGLFDNSCTVVGDHDMWLRISELYPLRYVPEELGLYLEYDDNLESRNPQKAYDEELAVKREALRRFMHPNFTPHVPFVVQQREHAAILAHLLDDVQNGRPVADLNALEFHFYAHAALSARAGDRTAALEMLGMFFALVNNSKNMCHLYRFVLCSSQGAGPGQLRVEPAVSLPPLVSVVVPLYNQGHFLAETVASVLAQTEPRWEMCIVNDGSTDTSLSLAKEVLATCNDPRIRLVSQANAGKGPTRNRGVRETSAPFICVLDADDMLVPTYFREALNRLDVCPDAGWVCPRTLVFGGNNHVTWEEEYDFFRSLLQCPCPVTALYRRALWDELGGYVESMTDREDWEFWVRAGEAGWTGITTPDVQFIYRHAFQRFGQQPQNNLRSKQEYVERHPWWFRALPPKELRAHLTAFSVGILPPDMLNPAALEAVRPFVGSKQDLKNAVERLKTKTPQTDSEAALRGAMPSTAKPPAHDPCDMDYLRRALLSGSLDIPPVIALTERPNIFAAPAFCPALYALRHESVRTQRRTIDMYATALHTGTVQDGQWTLPCADLQDIVLFHAAQLPAVHTQTCAANGILLGTSIAPKRIPEQQQAIATWIMQGFDVISVNYDDEISQLQPLFPQVRFVSALRDSMAVLGKKRIYVGDILHILCTKSVEYRCVGLVNSDVGLYQLDAEALIAACTKGLLFSHRINLPSCKPHTVGYDAFFFTQNMVDESSELDAYFLGEPWWDYAMQLYAVARSRPLLQASPPLCFHVEHPEQWDMESWGRIGRIFLPYLQQTLTRACGGALDLRPLTDSVADSHTLHWAASLLIYFCRHASVITAIQGKTLVMPKANTVCPPPAPSHRYVTYFDKNYLAKGLTLITSLREHDPGCRVDVVCLDKETRQALLRLDVPGVRPVDITLFEKDDPELSKIKNERSLVEYYWSLTPTVVLRLLEDMPQGEVLTYVDADLYFWASPKPVFEEMENADVLIHRHNFAPESKHLEAYGMYNVGLMCFRASEEGFKVLRWWRKKCLEWCGNYIDDDPEGGTRYGDQKYLERFESLSSAVHVCQYIGMGVAPWNHTKFSLTQNPAGQLCVDGQPVIMYHYHSFAILAPGCALPSTEAYPLTPEIVQRFHIPYLEAWEKAHACIRAVLPDFTCGFAPQALVPERCVLARAEQAHTFSDLGLTESVPLQNSRGEPYTLFVAPQLRTAAQHRSGTRRSSSLEASLANYLRFTQKPRLLNLGCGSHHHAAWLNVDIAPSTPGVHAVDLRGDWPLPENFFDVVYHSHVLEHMSQAQGTEYLRKCFAVLKPGGVLRVAVPDLEAIARNYIAALDSARQGTPGAEHRHAWMLLELIDQMARHHSGGGMAEYFKQVPLPEAAFVFERIGREGEHLAQTLQGKAPRPHEESDPLRVGAFRLGGEVHRWMYDPWSLRRALETAGFTDITHVDAVTSAWPDFASFNLDADSAGLVRKPDSFFMEARKPACGKLNNSAEK